MARQRADLHQILKSIVPNVYFQPPNGLKMTYPCIVYNRDNTSVQHADNSPYRHHKRYSLTVIDNNPDSTIPGEVSLLPFCEFSRFFTKDNLNHDVFNIFF